MNSVQALFLVLERVVVGLEDVLARHLLVGLEQVLHHAARRPSASLSGTLPTSNSLTPRTSTTSTAWCATTARPDSETMVGCGTPARVADLHARRTRCRWRTPAWCSSSTRRSWSASRRSRRPGRRRRRGTCSGAPSLRQLDVEAARLAQRVLDGADVGDLAAEVEVQELEAVEQARSRAGSRSPRPARATTGRTSSGRRPRPPTCPAPLGGQLARGCRCAGAMPICLATSAISGSSRGLLDDEDHLAAELARRAARSRCTPRPCSRCR